MRLKELQKIPYISHHNWFEAWMELGSSFGGKAEAGIRRLGRYAETWMNLLQVFGAEGIMKSAFVEQIPIESDELFHDLKSVLATDLGVVAILAGIAGCDTLVFDGEAPTFSSECTTLQFVLGGPLTMIGKFSQRPVYPTYWLFSPRLIHLSMAFALGGLTYRCTTAVCAKEPPSNEDSQGLCVLLQDLESISCRCQSMVGISAYQVIGLRAPALVLLAADTPRTARVFPSQQCQIFESLIELVRHCSFWRTRENHTTLNFGNKLRSAISPLIPLSTEEFTKAPISGERLEKRRVTMIRNKIKSRYVDLGYSWLAPVEAYDSDLGTDRRIKARPEWPIEVGSTGLVLIDGIIEACGAYITSGQNSLIGKSGELKAFFHTSLSCQLQEIDWWLGSKKALAACETCVLFEHMSPFELASANTSRTETKTLLIFTERRAVRAVLIFRALLIGMILGLALDNSALQGTAAGNTIVLLR
jgi:hypothetical protein